MLRPERRAARVLRKPRAGEEIAPGPRAELADLERGQVMGFLFWITFVLTLLVYVSIPRRRADEQG